MSFATPLDPTVVQVSTFTYTGSNDPASVADFESQLASIESILTASDGVQYSLLLDPKSYSDSSQSYVLQTTWNTYSDLHEMQKSSELTSAMTSALQSSTLSTANNTVNSDLYAENQQMLIGRFQIKSEDMDQCWLSAMHSRHRQIKSREISPLTTTLMNLIRTQSST